MRFVEVALFGVYMAPIPVMIGAACLVLIALRRLVDHFGLLHHVWHSALFVYAWYMITFSSRSEVCRCRALTEIGARQAKRWKRRPPDVTSDRDNMKPRRRVVPILITLGYGRGRGCGLARLGNVADLHGCALDA